MFDELSPPAIDAAHGFDVEVRVGPSPTVFPDHAEYVSVKLVLGTRVLTERSRVPKRSVESVVRVLASEVEPMLARERRARDGMLTPRTSTDRNAVKHKKHKKHSKH